MSEDSSAQLPDTINDADNELFSASQSSSVSRLTMISRSLVDQSRILYGYGQYTHTRCCHKMMQLYFVNDNSRDRSAISA